MAIGTKKKFVKCKCSHDHVIVLPIVDKEGFEIGGMKPQRLDECCECNCENFKKEEVLK